MSYTVGVWWFWIYGVIALTFLVAGVIWIFSELIKREFPLPGVITFCFGGLLMYLSIFAGTHFRVPVNMRALIIDNIKGEVVGTRNAGIQGKPLFGVTVCNWPANKAYQVFLDLEPGTASASSKDQIALWVDTKHFLDLSRLDLERSYRAVNGCWDTFFEKYLETQLFNLVRQTSKDYTVLEHNTKKSEWAMKFDQNANVFFSDGTKGYQIQIVPGRTTMSWDFVNTADAEAFDQAHRSAFLITQRLNEQKALEIEKEMAQTRAEILETTAGGATQAWDDVVTFIESLPPQSQKFLEQFMQLQANLEYLRLVGQHDPEVFFPPGSSLSPVYDSSEKVIQPLPQPQTQTTELEE
jgi:hypothetical protein